MNADNKQILKDIINKISYMCTNENIINHINNLIRINKDYITEINNKYLRSVMYNEEFEINISDNYFTVYSTSWGSTTRRKITFFKIDNRIIVSFDDNQVTTDGIINKNYKYEFEDNKLIHNEYFKRVNLEFEIHNTIKRIKKQEEKELIPLDDNTALEKVTKNNQTYYYIVNIQNITFDNLEIYSSVHCVTSEFLTLEEYDEKIKKLKVVK